MTEKLPKPWRSSGAELHLTDGELVEGGRGLAGGLEGRGVQAHTQLGSPGPLPRIRPAAFTFILKHGGYRVQRLVALSLSAGCSTLALPSAGFVTLGK